MPGALWKLMPSVDHSSPLTETAQGQNANDDDGF